MNGFEKELENRILGVIPHSVIYSDEPIKNYENLIKDIKNYPDIIDASPYINIQGLISSEYESKGINIIGIDVAKEENMSIIPQYMVAGELESLNQSNSIVLGSLLAANISAYIGDEINITTSDIKTSIIGSYPTSVNLKVVGIFELKTELDQFMTLVSHDTAQKLKNISSDETLSIRLKTNNLFNADYISLETIELINNNDLSYSSWKDTHGTLFEAIKFEKLLISLMLFLIVAVASILVLSTVMMTVKSKEREVGILLTLGASSKQIILIFFTQGLIVSLVGIIFGIIFGFLLTYNLTNIILFLETALERNLLEAYFINYFPYHINLFQIFIICITSFALSLISSLIPSIRAVRLNPVQILRHE
jgi:lipoprotein-releasing system permease protein